MKPATSEIYGKTGISISRYLYNKGLCQLIALLRHDVNGNL